MPDENHSGCGGGSSVDARETGMVEVKRPLPKRDSRTSVNKIEQTAPIELEELVWTARTHFNPLISRLTDTPRVVGALGPVRKVRLTDRMRRRTGCRSGRVNEQGGREGEEITEGG
ncbi:hypothetical protein ALC60_10715 [Trachymyrmex zeteki]|uniref:Uncharacterized protein n=1 Tax=Mycetomoellerius zeteki TaxID=64791 RepID=A0A151WQK4_9HYME|nr:hypothetical protein ALC60_10715 [Trachymyrmex zeteki]